MNNFSQIMKSQFLIINLICQTQKTKFHDLPLRKYKIEKLVVKLMRFESLKNISNLYLFQQNFY